MGREKGKQVPYLAAWRDYRLMPQTELAQKAGVSVGTISRLESTHMQKTASLATISKIATALGVTREQLLYEPAPKWPAKGEA